jgi:hypothetical protein
MTPPNIKCPLCAPEQYPDVTWAPVRFHALLLETIKEPSADKVSELLALYNNMFIRLIKEEKS